MRSLSLFFCVLAACFAASFNASAQALPTSVSTVFPMTVQGNITTFGASSANAANAASLAFSNSANGPMYAQSFQQMNLGNAARANVYVKSVPASVNVAGAIGRFATKLATPLVVGVALYDLAQELGFTASNANGPFSLAGAPVPWSPFNNPYNAGADGIPDCGPNSFQTLGYCRSFNAIFGIVTTADRDVLLSMGWGYADNGGTVHRVYGPVPVGSTPSVGRVVPLQEFVDAIAAKSGWPSGSAIGRTASDAVASGEVIPLPVPVEIVGPTAVPLAPRTVTNPDGSSSTTNREKQLGYGPNTVTTTDREAVTNTNPQGVTSAGPMTQTPAEPEPEKETCGLPDTPPCRLDPSGMPDAEGLPVDAAKEKYNPIKELIDNPASKLPAIPSINWAFALPSGCAVISLGNAFAPYLTSIDVCQYQPMFHEIMSMVWMLGGLFGAISLFMKSSLSD